jgi:hypothetical protein
VRGTAKKPTVRVSSETGRDATPPHMIYRTAYVEASNRAKAGPKARNGAVTVALGEMDWQHSGVYLGIHSKYRLDNAHECEGAFEDFISLKQLDDIVELLLAVRSKARELGILTPRPIPKVAGPRISRGPQL